jgi:hypothetical protein
MKTMSVRPSVRDLVSAIKRLSDFHKMRHRSSCQKVAKHAPFVNIGSLSRTSFKGAHALLPVFQHFWKDLGEPDSLQQVST